MRITKLSADQWQSYRDLRLLALKTDPEAFGSSYEEEADLTESEWRSRINAMWFALVDDQVVGLVGLLNNENISIKHYGVVVSLWVKPEFRGGKIAKALIKSVQDAATGSGLRKLLLHVTPSQMAAVKLYEHMGFKKVGLLREGLFKNGRYFDECLMEWYVDKNLTHL